MKRIILIGFGVVVALLTFKAAAQTGNESITGTWYAEELDQSVIEVVTLEDGSYEGVIKSSSKADYVSHKVLYDFEYDVEKNHFAGTISSAARNMELDGTIVLEEDGRLKLVGKKFFMTKTFYWVRKN